MTRTAINKIKKSEIDVHKSGNHYFLEINSKNYDVFRSFDTLDELIRTLRKYPIENREKVIAEIKRLDRLK